MGKNPLVKVPLEDFPVRRLTEEEITYALEQSERWGINDQPTIEKFSHFLSSLPIIGLEVEDDDTIKFKTIRPLTPSEAFRLGRFVKDNEPEEIFDWQTEFRLWWD